jgi:hypothetical protein
MIQAFCRPNHHRGRWRLRVLVGLTDALLNLFAETAQFAQQLRRPLPLCEVHSTGKSVRRTATGRPPILNERICSFLKSAAVAKAPEVRS